MSSPSDVPSNNREGALFDLADEYDAMLARGLRLSGESRDFYMRGRVAAVASLLASSEVSRILDFGCGTGETSTYLSRVFQPAGVVGVDTAEGALKYARRRHATARVRFCHPDEVTPATFDLCYVNGVFHHVSPSDRPRALALIHRALRPGGWFAFFENNPWNLGTRIIMSRVPFDRGAMLISPPRARRTLEGAGFETPVPNRYLFFFPRALRWLRCAEPALSRFPLGGQYLTMVRRPSG